MRRSLVIMGVVSVLVGALALVYYFILRPVIIKNEVMEQFSVAPDFSLPDAQGTLINLSEVEGDVKIVTFWASWSPYSKDDLTALARIKKEFGEQVAILALNRDYNPAEGKVYLESLHLGSDLLFVYDSNDEYYRKVEGFAMPLTLFLTDGERIVFETHGPMTYEQMKEQVTKMLQ